ncbi:MAG: ParB/RepB/Spo0J family partition protein [Elusimicrobiota bacterium]|jgi:ParB family chromosome partitioning protein|nr:ParB/RepB/Spo0J family partition protein [Elusimicrobiota bacterium]
MKKQVLGRGLESLSPYFAPNKFQSEEFVISISLEKIRPNRFQPRNKFDEKKLQELAISIKKYGLAQPILVVPSVVPGEYEIIAGERRFRAAKLADVKTIKAIVRKSVDDKQRLDLALIENIQRENLNPIEEAQAYKKLLDNFKRTHEEIAQAVGKDRSVISNFLRLLLLPNEVQELLSEKKLTLGHGKMLAGLEDEEQIKYLAQQIINENLSVRTIERLIAETKSNKPKIKPKKQFDEMLIKLKEEMQRKFSSKVNILGTENKGKIEIRYGSLEELERIRAVLNIEIG